MTVRAALIGYGLAGRVFHAPLITADDSYELAAIVTGDPDRARAAHERYPGARIVATVDELLDREGASLDVVIVAAPTPQHVPVATRTIGAGIPTVVDKPLSVRLADGEGLVALAEESGVLLTTFQNRRWDGDFLTVERLVDGGALGEVRRFESRFEWISSRPRPPWKTQTSGPDGGGVAYDLGSHLIDQAIRLFGPVDDVYGELDRRGLGAVNDDDSFIALHHANGVRSHLAMSSIVAQRGFRFRVLGSESAYTKWGLDAQEGQLAGGMSPLDPAYGLDSADAYGLLGRDGDAVRVATEPGGYREFYRLLAAALAGQGPVPVDPRDALVAVGILERLHERHWGR